MAETRRQLLEQQLAQSQQLLQQAQNPDLFGNGRAGAFGAIAQGITAGIGAYGKAKARREILVNESQNIDLFKQFAISKGNQPLADVAGSLSPETREAYILQSTSPRYTSFNQFTPAKIQEFEYYQNLPSEDLRKQFLNVQRNTTGEGAFLKQGGAIEVLPNYGQAGAQKKGLETEAQKRVELTYEPTIAGAKTFQSEAAKTDVESQEKARGIISQTDALDNTLKLLETHPGLTDIVGAKGGGQILSYVGKEDPIQGTNSAGAKALFDQVKGQQFLQAFENLRGGGQITEKEGEAATKALSALSLATNEKDFIANIKILREIMTKVKTKAIERSAQGYQRPSSIPQQQTKQKQQTKQIEKSTIIKKYNPQTGRIE